MKFEVETDTGKLIDRGLNVLYFGVTILIAVSVLKSLKGTLGNMGKGGGGNDVFGFGKSNVK